MKVLWITNILFPDICKQLGIEAPVTGGWMKSSAQALLELNKDIDLAVATLYGNKFQKHTINNITYYCLPFDIYTQKNYNPDIERYWEKVSLDFHPDIVHIHGTEFPHGLAYMKKNGTNNIVISIQGLISIIARYCLGQIPIKTLKKYQTIHDIIKGHTLKLPKKMRELGKLEEEYFTQAKYVIGRTDWDKDHVWAINPNIKYYFCNETLRHPFYQSIGWDIKRCEQYSIFLSQAQTPIKGIHKLIEAMPYIIRQYPKVKVYIAGANFLQKKTLKDKLKFGTYANYISHLIYSYKLQDYFIFTGFLNEEQMEKRYRKSHVFVCPSSIENSPNSLGEAQLIGVPVVASYVGGIPNMVDHKITGMLYRYEEHEMLAKCICEIFENETFAQELSANERNIAQQRHNKQKNALCTYNIYNSIIKNK